MQQHPEGSIEAEGLLQERRSLLRHEQVIRKEREKRKDKKSITDLLAELDAIEAEDVSLASSEEKKLKKADIFGELEAAKTSLQEQIATLAITQKEEEKIIEASTTRLLDYDEKRRRILRRLSRYETVLQNLERTILLGSVGSQSVSLYGELGKRRDVKREMERELESLQNESPEAFIAHWLLELRRYKREIPSGIVETQYPKRIKEEAKEKLLQHGFVALVGETGTGKTRLSRKIAEELSESGTYQFVAGHRYMTAADLYAYLGIDVDRVPAEDTPARIKIAKDAFLKKKRIESDETQVKLTEEEEHWIEEVVLGQAKEANLKTQIFHAAILQGAELGEPVVIDEFNYIPSNLLAGINPLIAAKPGDTVDIFGKKVVVKKGFCVILNGNISRTGVQRYIKREPTDPALVSRLNSGLIEYGSLPQDTETTLETSILSRKECEKGKEIPERELFQIALALITDKKGNLAVKEDTLRGLWGIASEFSLLQKLYGKETIHSEVKLPGERDPQLNLYPISNRTFFSILESWVKEGCEYELDWYIYDHLIRPAQVIAPTEAAQMFTLLKLRGGFFQGKQWEETIQVDSTTWKITGIDDIERDKASFKEGQINTRVIRFYTPKEIAEAMAGVSAPSFETSTSQADTRKTEIAERVAEYTEKLQVLEARHEAWGRSVELFCLDEAAIRGESCETPQE